MNGQFQDDWLSAYLDGEATREERAEVERRLEASPETRQELEDLRDLSSLLHGLRRHHAPAELRAAVLQSAERATLLPPARGRKRSWKYIAMSLATSVAAVMAMVGIWQLRAPNEIAPGGQFAKEQTSREADSLVADRSSAVPPANLQTPAAAFRSTEDSAEETAMAASVAVAAARDGDQPESNRTVTSPGNSRLVFNADDLDGANVGDVIQAMDNSGEELTIVKLTVVDRQDGLETLQFLLSKNQIRSEPDAAMETGRQSADEMVAVYVESSRTQLAVALQEFMREQQFQELEVEGPIRIASLDPDSQARIGLRGTRSASTERRQSSPPSGRATPSQAIEQPGEAAASAANAERRAESSVKSSSQELVASRQRQLHLPAELLETERDKIASAPRAPYRDKQVAAQPSSLHVLFVIVGDETGGGPSESPPQTPGNLKRPRPIPFRDGAA